MAANLSIADVADRLSKEHRLKAVGRLDRGTLQYQVLADTLATDPLDLEDRVIAEKNGQSIRLRDLGRVTIGHEDRTMAIRSNGKDAVALTVFRRLGGNALAVSRALEAVLADAAKSAPPGVAIHPVYDQGLLVRTAIANVRDAIVIGGLMSVAVLLLFLKSLRATLIAALSIPLSLIITLRLPLPDRRHAQPDVAGRPGGGHRPDHRRHRGRDREHRAAPGRGADRRPGRGPRQPRDQRRGHRLDPDDDPGLRAPGVRPRGRRPVLPVAEHLADRRAGGLDGRQPDDHPGPGRPLPGPPADADDGPDL